MYIPAASQTIVLAIQDTVARHPIRMHLPGAQEAFTPGLVRTVGRTGGLHSRLHAPLGHTKKGLQPNGLQAL